MRSAGKAYKEQVLHRARCTRVRARWAELDLLFTSEVPQIPQSILLLTDRNSTLSKSPFMWVSVAARCWTQPKTWPGRLAGLARFRIIPSVWGSSRMRYVNWRWNVQDGTWRICRLPWSKTTTWSSRWSCTICGLRKCSTRGNRFSRLHKQKAGISTNFI